MEIRTRWKRRVGGYLPRWITRTCQGPLASTTIFNLPGPEKDILPVIGGSVSRRGWGSLAIFG
jgi:hypothetical protein